MQPIGIVNAMVIEINMALNWKNAILLNRFYRVEKAACYLDYRGAKNFEGQLSYWLLVLYCFGTFLYHWDRAIFYKYMTIEKWWTCN